MQYERIAWLTSGIMASDAPWRVEKKEKKKKNAVIVSGGIKNQGSKRNTTSGLCILATLTGLLNFQLVFLSQVQIYGWEWRVKAQEELMYSTCPGQQDQISPTLTHWFSQFDKTQLLTFKLDASPKRKTDSLRVRASRHTWKNTLIGSMHWTRTARNMWHEKWILNWSVHQENTRNSFNLRCRKQN